MPDRIWEFEDFLQMEVIRTRGVAEVIVDHFRSTPGDGFEADDGKPVRLMGFEADVGLTDFEVLESAYEYYVLFCEMLGVGKKHGGTC